MTLLRVEVQDMLTPFQVPDPPQSYANVIRTGSSTVVINDSMRKNDARAPLMLTTAPPQSRFGAISKQAVLNIQRGGGGGGVPSRGVVSLLGNVSVCCPAGVQSSMALTLTADAEYSATSISTTTSFSSCPRHKAHSAASRYSQFPLLASRPSSPLPTT